MNVRLAILFAAVAEEKSFTRAAARLNIAQPWLSAQIRKFEDQLGFQLFHRGKGPTELTKEGERMFGPAMELAASAQRVRDLSRAISLEVALYVRVGAHVSSAAVPEFARLNDEFAVRFRDTALIVEAGATNDLIEQIKNGRLDVAMVMAPFDESGLEMITLHEVTPYVLTPRGSALAKHSKLTLSALAGARLGVMRRALHAEFYDTVHARLEAAGAELKPTPEPGARAMDHFARSQQLSVLMVEGDPADYARDAELVARPLSFCKKARHILVKRTDLERRAVTRYWRTAQAIAGAEHS